MVEVLARGAPWESLLLGAIAYVVSLAVLGIVPVALSSLERMSDNATFELVFSKYTRKMITFRQEHMSDPVLSEEAKQVKERAVWRMMAMARTQPQVIRNVGTLVVTGSIVAVKAPSLLPILVGFGVPTMFFELRHACKRAELEEELAPAWGLLWGDLYQLMVAQPLAMLHQFGAALWFALRYKRGLADASAVECQLEVQAAASRVLGALLVGVGLAISIALLLKFTLGGDLTVGEFVLVSGALSSLAAGLAEFASLLGQQWSQSKSIKDLTDLLEHPHTETISTRVKSVADEYRGACGESAGLREEELSAGAQVTVDDVWLRYASAEKGDFALKGISFSIPAGSVVAVVGPNGAGKSSTMSTLLRQFEPTHGRILINGVPINQMTREEFSRKVVMMPQQFRHFNLTVRELLNLGRATTPAADEVLWYELERVGVLDCVKKWKCGLDTHLGVDRRGAVEPSGGQLQRLILAAVVIANRGLIVLDEPVSMVDPEAAKRFWDAVFSEAKNRTVIFSTHHLGAVRRASFILFVEDGVVAAQGTHEELMTSSERYRLLFEAQASDYR
jgi:ABC-type multidrug transport system fused ATPase/permease subunit